MGLVLLDVQFRIEEEFRIRLPDDWIESIGLRKTGDDCTIATLERFIASQIESSGNRIPTNFFDRLQKILFDASGLRRRQQITRETFLVKDLFPGAG